MIRVLAFVEWYFPGWRAGGPPRTIAAMVDRLQGEVAFRIVTRDHDLGQSDTYDLPRKRWHHVDSAQVLYAARSDLSVKPMSAVLADPWHDVLYLNSVFSPAFGIKPLVLTRLGVGRRTPVVIAARGELAPGALGLKAFKKRPFLILARYLGLYRRVVWHASGAQEVEDIGRAVGATGGAPITVTARDLVPRESTPVSVAATAAGKGALLRVAFLARICRMKNLDGALKAIAKAREPMVIDVAGPIEDPDYWQECLEIVSSFRSHLRMRHVGPLEPAKVGPFLQAHDLLFHPSHGESFGHSIIEALAAGRPVLISDRTPWRGLQASHAGWEFPLDASQAFAETLDACARMSVDEYNVWSAGAKAFAERVFADEDAIAHTRRVFSRAIAAPS